MAKSAPYKPGTEIKDNRTKTLVRLNIDWDEYGSFVPNMI